MGFQRSKEQRNIKVQQKLHQWGARVSATGKYHEGFVLVKDGGFQNGCQTQSTEGRGDKERFIKSGFLQVL